MAVVLNWILYEQEKGNRKCRKVCLVELQQKLHAECSSEKSSHPNTSITSQW